MHLKLRVLAVTLLSLCLFASPVLSKVTFVEQSTPIIVPFRLPPPLYQTIAQLEAANRYWTTHSIGFNHPERQTREEAARSLYYQTHPNLGYAMHSGAGSTAQHAGMPQNNSRAPEYCAQYQRRGINSPFYTTCCTQITPCTISSQTVYSQCPAAASCVWGSDGFGDHPYNNSQVCQNNGGCEVVVHPGLPTGQCTPGSSQVGDTIGFINGVAQSVVDINAIFQADGIAFGTTVGLAIPSHVWGWVYKTDSGFYYIQANPAFLWTASFAAAVNSFGTSIGVSINAPTGTSPQGPLLKPPTLPAGQRYNRCFTHGNSWG